MEIIMARDKLINLEIADNHLFVGNKDYFTDMYEKTRKTLEKMYIKEILPAKEYTEEEILEHTRKLKRGGSNFG